MTASENAYLAIESEEYVDRIARKAETHNVRLRVEAQAALNAALAMLLRAMHDDGDPGDFRLLVNDAVNDIIEAKLPSHHLSDERINPS